MSKVNRLREMREAKHERANTRVEPVLVGNQWHPQENGTLIAEKLTKAIAGAKGGKIGGKAKSPAKTAAAQANGKKGGKPKAKPA